LQDLETKIPEIISGIISLFSGNPVIGGIASLIAAMVAIGFSIWYNSVKNKIAHKKTEEARQQDNQNLIEEINQIETQANQADQDIDALRRR
jgi:uncharacterized protein (DUF697 family)